MSNSETADISVNAAQPNSSSRLVSEWSIEAAFIALMGDSFGHIGYRLFRISGEFVAVIFGLGILWLYGFARLSTQQSVNIEFTKPWVAQEFAKTFEGSSANIEALHLRWLPATNRISFEAQNIEIEDEDQNLLQAFENLRTEFDLHEAVALKLQPKAVRLKGGSVTWLTDKNGAAIIGLGTPETVGRFGPVYRGGVQDDTQSTYLNLGFDSFEIQSGNVFILNKNNDLSLDLKVKNLQASLVGDILRVKLEGEAVQEEMNAPFHGQLITAMPRTEVSFALNAQNVRLDQLAPKRGRFKGLRHLAAPIDLTTNVSLDSSGPDSRYTPTSALIDISIGSGALLGFDTALDFDSFDFSALFDPDEQSLKISNLSLLSERLNVKGTGAFTELSALSDGDINSSPIFDIRLNEVMANVTPLFESPFILDAITARGTADFDDRSFKFDQLIISSDRYDVDMTLSGHAAKDFSLRDIKGAGQVNGVFSHENLTELWPVNFATGARNWIDRSILSGLISPLSFKFNLDEAFFIDRVLTPERLQVDFGVKAGDVRYISTMTPLLGTSGAGAIMGNQLYFNYAGGGIGTLNVSSGRIDIPNLLPKGGDIIIKVNGDGQASDMMALLNQEPFKIAERYGLEPESLGGFGQITATITRPLLVNFDQNRVTYDVEGDFSEAVAPFKVGDFSIDKGEVKLKASRSMLEISGPAHIGPWPVNIDWKETFGEQREPARYKVSGWLDRDVLDEFGVGLRQFFDGRIKVDIDGFGMDPAQQADFVNSSNLPFGQFGLASGTLRADLSEAEITLGDVWAKQQTQGGVLTTVVDRLSNGGLKFSDITMEAPGFYIAGDLSLAENMRLLDLDLTRAKIDGLVDGVVKLKPDTEQKRLSLFVEGGYLNVSPWTTIASRERSAGIDIPLLVTASIDELVLKPDYTVTNSRLLFAHTGVSVSGFRLAGQTQEGAFKAEMLQDAEDDGRKVTLSVPNASKAAKAFLGLGTTKNGNLELRAKLPPIDQEGPIIGQAIIRDFNMQKTPFLAQILSLSSLTGLGDMLSGDGLRFEKFTVPFTYENAQVKIRDARLRGPVLGMTGDGDVNLDNRVLDFDGTLVPAYTANSMLGGVPIFGDILVGKKGSGILALSYTVKGPFEKTQITVNPLSAITPGFLRGIFKSDREDIPDEVMEQIKAVAPTKEDIKKPNETGG